MSKNIYGGGSHTNINGLAFEQETDLRDALLKIPGYTIKNNKIYFNEKYVIIIKNTIIKKDTNNVLLNLLFFITFISVL